MTYTRITIRADQMGGLPCIRGLRIPVVRIIAMLADGMTEPEILADYPDLEPEDIREARAAAGESPPSPSGLGFSHASAPQS